MSEVVDWLTAIGTCGAVLVSLGLASLEFRSRRKHDERRQAELVTAWFAPDEFNEPDSSRVGLHVQNASSQMIYDLVAESLVERHTAVGGDEQTNQTYGACVGNVQPGAVTARIDFGDNGMHHRHRLEYAFQDAGGRYWLRRGDGKLKRVRKHPLDLFQISQPVIWQNA